MPQGFMSNSQSKWCAKRKNFFGTLFALAYTVPIIQEKKNLFGMKNYFRFSIDDADRECIIEAHKGKGKENANRQYHPVQV